MNLHLSNPYAASKLLIIDPDLVTSLMYSSSDQCGGYTASLLNCGFLGINGAESSLRLESSIWVG